MRLARRRELTRRRQLGGYYDHPYRVKRYEVKPYPSVPPLRRVITDSKKAVVGEKPRVDVRRRPPVVLGSTIPGKKPNVVRGYVVSYVRRQAKKLLPGRYIPDCKKRKSYRKGMMRKLAAQVRKAGGQGAIARWRGKLLRKIFC